MPNEESVEQEARKDLKEQFGLELEDIHTVKISLNFAGDKKGYFAATNAILDAVENSKYQEIRSIFGGSNLSEIFLSSSATAEQLEVLTKGLLPKGRLSKIEELDVKFYESAPAILMAAPKQG